MGTVGSTCRDAQSAETGPDFRPTPPGSLPPSSDALRKRGAADPPAPWIDAGATHLGLHKGAIAVARMPGERFEVKQPIHMASSQ